MSDPSEGEWRRDRIRLTLPNDLAQVAVARSAVRAAAQPYGYSTTELDDWETVIEEAVTNVVRFAYDPGEHASFDIDCLLGANGLTVKIRDHGRPFDPRRIQPVEFDSNLKIAPEHDLGWHLMQRLMDVVAIESLGRDGKELSLFKAAPHRFDPAALPVRTPARNKPLDGATGVVFRKATPDDAIEIMLLFYACYRYSYFNEQVYSPQGLGRMIATGEIESFVGQLPGGRLVAHVALIHYLDRPNLIELGMSAVDPGDRGRHLSVRIVELASERIARSGKRIVFAGCVTAHVAAQKTALHYGSECALMLGAVPAESLIGFKRKHQGRDTILFLASLRADRPPPTLVLPTAHATFIGGLYELCRIPFTRGEAATAAAPSESDITISVRPKVGAIRAVVLRIGGDLIDRIKAMMHAARQSWAEVGQLFLPLTDRALPDAVAALEPLGWFVTGMLPEGSTAGDILIMHWLNGWAMDYDTIKLARPEGRQLLQQVQARDPEGR